MSWTRTLETLDRRWLFLVMALLVAGPLVFPAGLPLKVSRPVQSFNDTIDKLPNGATILMSCDYTLIGEELYAASAYLSGEPKLVGALKGADLMKLVIITAVIAGCVLETLGRHGFKVWMTTQ